LKDWRKIIAGNVNFMTVLVVLGQIEWLSRVDRMDYCGGFMAYPA
jgi:hypothetical protein